MTRKSQEKKKEILNHDMLCYYTSLEFKVISFLTVILLFCTFLINLFLFYEFLCGIFYSLLTSILFFKHIIT